MPLTMPWYVHIYAVFVDILSSIFNPDEFDVFMDAVNRRISMKMLIESARMSDKKQYIFITPQDMANVVIGDSVKVHRMSDPERREIR